MKKRATRTPLIAFPLAMVCCLNGAAQTQSPSDLILFLTYRSDRPDKQLAEMGIVSCGITGDREAAMNLARQGPAALPDIEKELDAIERRGQYGFGSSWLELAFARIKGPAAFGRLRRLEQDPRFGSEEQFGDDSARRSLDGALALSLGLTSFVSAPENGIPTGTRSEPTLDFQCDRRADPRDALNRLIRAFERNDAFLFQASLGPDAKTALNALLAKTSWNQMRAALLREKSAGDFTVGYKFEASGGWSEPPETLADRGPIDTRREPMLAAHFKTRSGADCAEYRVHFVLTPADGRPAPWTPYLVNDSDLGELVRVIASCSAKQ
jgi:hypothetical protein